MSNIPERVKVEVSISSLLKIAAFGIGAWAIYQIRDIIVLFFIVIVLVATLSPTVALWQKRWGRGLAVTFLFLLTLLAVGVISALLIPPVVSQLGDFVNSLPNIVTTILPSLSDRTGELNLDKLVAFLQTSGGPLQKVSLSFFQGTLGVFSGIATIFTVLVLTFYLLLEEQGIKEFLFFFIPADRRAQVSAVTDKVISKIGDWLRGQLSLMVIIGLLSFVGLIILQVPFSLSLALIAALTEIIPYIGPVIGAVPAIALAFTQSPVQALLVMILYVVIQQLEAQIIVPKVMQRAVGLSPVVIILALLIGGKLFGTMGAILAVPVAASAKIILDEWPSLIRRISK